MSEERLKRKITIILATDVFGYSKHIEEDETLTIKVCPPETNKDKKGGLIVQSTIIGDIMCASR